jgi:phenylacetate-CoA ligase
VTRRSSRSTGRCAGRHLAELVKRTIGVTVGVEVTGPGGIERSVGKMRRIVDQRPPRRAWVGAPGRD